ncbi:unnamed protein product [Fusarium langsethiae]|nr:unnamed protein product [Fusarium langsethiae]
MTSITYDIDPTGDLIVVLKDPNTQWVVPEVTLLERVRGSTTCRVDNTDVNTPEMTSGLGNSEKTIEVRFRVSSACLTLASDVFNKMLNGPWKESIPTSPQSASRDKDTAASEHVDAEELKDIDVPGSSTDPSPPTPPTIQNPSIREVTTEGWNAQALLTVFRIIHCQRSLVSGNVSLEFIAQVAIIVNYYQCAGTNTQNDTGKRPSYMACQVELHGQGLGHVTTHDLEIDEILGKLEIERKILLDRLYSGLTGIKQRLLEGKIGCHHECRSMMPGSLMMEKFKKPDLPLEDKDKYRSFSVYGFIDLIFILSIFGISASAITDINFIMKVIQHDIDPGGDLLIVLKCPNSLILTPHLPKEDDVCQPLPFSSLSIFGDDFGSKDVEVEFRVSSYHMIQSSTFFEKMLKGPWKETQAENRDIESRFQALSCEETAEDIATTPIRIRRVSATGWNANALATVLNIIHGNTSGKHVPRDVNYVFLAQVAVIVDYYQCEGCVLVATELWRGTVDFPELVHSNIMKLYISWVFSWDKRFSHAAWHSSADSLGLTLSEINDLPVAELLDILEHRRQDGIEKILTRFDDLAEIFLDNCSYMCPAAVLAMCIHHRTRNQPLRGIPIREMSNHIRNPTADDDEHTSIKMVSITYEIDSGGDIELVLNKPNNQKIIPVLRFTKDLRDLDDEKFDNPPCLGRYSVFQELYSLNETNVSPVDSEVRLRVSSRHLILASRTFRAMLEGPWSEATSSYQSVRQINATGWDAMAFAVVLDIIHGRPRGIPERMNIGLLARIATVVDYYECHDAMHACLKNWLSENPELSDPMLNLCKTSLLCLYVAWVFSEKSTISNMTYLALSHGEGLAQIDTFDLPLGVMLDKIDEKRQSLISKSLQLFDDLRKDLLDEQGCPQRDELECTALTLGVLMRAQYQLSSPDRPLERPYNGYSITNVLRMITGIMEPSPLHFNSGPWSENSSSVSKVDDRPEIIASGWDPVAFVIVLDAVHGRYNDIPEKINVGLLARIAAIVDYYELHESLRLISNLWMKNLCDSYKMPTKFSNNSLMWLYIAWVFSKRDVLSPMSKLLLREGIGLSYIHLGDLPLSSILEKIDAKRQELIGRLMTGLYGLRNELLTKMSCHLGNRRCSTLMLGSLIRKLHKLELLDTPAVTPYSGHSVSGIVAETVESSEHEFGCHDLPRDSPLICLCTIELELSDLLDEIEKDISDNSLT